MAMPSYAGVEERSQSGDFAVVVMGGSRGAISAFQRLIGGVPATIPAAFLLVLHVGAFPSRLPEMLSSVSALPAGHAATGEPIRAGRVYVAPPDHHLKVVDGGMALSRGPKENWTRPAIDPLFRTAARAYGPRVVGVILTGGLNDGTAGLYEVKQRGGTAVVQDPADAESPDMPRSALRHVAVDHCLPLAEMPKLLLQLSNEIAAAEARQVNSVPTGGPHV